MFDLALRGVAKTDSTLLRLRLIGRMEATTLTGESVLPVGGKTKGLLAILALSDRKPVARSHLAELLWSRRPDDLARASLRQEIHRLLDALSPLGVDVIDVQRHTLALKPALTSVDVERILNGGKSILRELPPPSEVLLGELNGIDPAFNEWIEGQRTRLNRHIYQLFESALRTQVDPDAILDTADHLLVRDGLNEAAWRARIQAWVTKGEYAQAAALGDQVVQLFQDQLGTVPGPATMGLVRSLQERIAFDSYAKAHHGGSAEMDAALVHADMQPEGGKIFPPVSGDVAYLASPVSTRTLGSIAVAPLKAAGGAHAETLAAELTERLEVKLVGLQTFTVVPFPETAQADTGPLLGNTHNPGTDYVISGLVRANTEHGESSEGYVIIRLLSLRQEGSVVWADRFELPKDTRAQRALLFYVMKSLQWSLFVSEGQRMMSRPIAELSAFQMAVRALTLLLRCDVTLSTELRDLVERAYQSDQESVFVLYVRSLIRFFLYQENWSSSSQEEIEDIASAAGYVAIQLRANPLGVWLSMMTRTFTPGQLDEAKALTAEYTGATGVFPAIAISPSTHALKAAQALLSEEKAVALEEIQQFRALRASQPLAVLSEPFSIFVLEASGNNEEARQAGAAFVSLYPRSATGVLYYLVALASHGMGEETERVKRHLLRLVPDVTISGVLSRHDFLPESMQLWLREMLTRVSLPQG
ncbi:MULTISPECIES: BTAD domain-containing putative transcriptional regulator [Asaia]|uniref:Bacterial transcriptional activator domain-containing protein n=1 Tax=Asaia bogorensis TaxID=91915 RepID=A0A060QHG3_9PROT|nr:MULTISPECIES: BTAD domain-containing putative transcriptional regulator [Asaia]ETC98270.1 hypothetical protein P792_10935 [Asaia sp. SF2.1]MDL2171731.1 BTAD domain-containing putative transcriptional regulator [Asaia sp. HumB]CDG40138.1 hypothetical protein ASAP_2093 [Asaia bogorensis]